MKQNRNRPRNDRQSTSHLQPTRQRRKIAPIPAKPCIVTMRYEFLEEQVVERLVYTRYDPDAKVLYPCLSGEATEFSSKREAHKAISHTLESYKAKRVVKSRSRTPYHADDFKYEFRS